MRRTLPREVSVATRKEGAVVGQATAWGARRVAVGAALTGGVVAIARGATELAGRDRGLH